MIQSRVYKNIHVSNLVIFEEKINLNQDMTVLDVVKPISVNGEEPVNEFKKLKVSYKNQTFLLLNRSVLGGLGDKMIELQLLPIRDNNVKHPLKLIEEFGDKLIESNTQDIWRN